MRLIAESVHVQPGYWTLKSCALPSASSLWCILYLLPAGRWILIPQCYTRQMLTDSLLCPNVYYLCNQQVFVEAEVPSVPAHIRFQYFSGGWRKKNWKIYNFIFDWRRRSVFYPPFSFQLLFTVLRVQPIVRFWPAAVSRKVTVSWPLPVVRSVWHKTRRRKKRHDFYPIHLCNEPVIGVVQLCAALIFITNKSIYCFPIFI